MQFVDVGTARLAYTKTGTGPDLVFVHGWPLHGETWRAIVPVLATRFTCHVLDLPGAGKTEYTAGTRITLRAHADAIVRAIDVLGLDRVGFVAHDSGGGIARIAAAKLGTRCFGLVLGNTELPNHRPPALVAMAALARLPYGDRLLPLILRSRRLRHSNLGLGGCFHDRSLIDRDFGARFITPLLASPGGQLELLKQLEWNDIATLADTHAKITAPVLLVWGVDDPWFPLRRAREMVGQFPGGCTLVEMQDAKLFAHEEHPAEWAAHAMRFFEPIAFAAVHREIHARLRP